MTRVLRLPVGELVETPDRRLRVTMAHNARTRGLVQSIVERLDGIAAEWFWIPTTVDEYEGDLVLEYSLAADQSMTFSEALPRMRARPAVYLPEIVEMARYLEACTRVLAQVEVTALIAPACLRYAPDRDEGAWRLMVVPLVDATLADWARAIPESWMWTPSRALLGRSAPNAGAYAVGAALCHALAGDLFPTGLPSGGRFRRTLGGPIGPGARLTGIVAKAVPDSFGDEGLALSALALALLEPTPPSDWQKLLAQLGEQLAPYRTAVRWEYEGKVDVARGILERFAASTPKEHVPWDVLSRLRGADQDYGGALEAAIDALGSGDEGIRDLAAVTRRIAHSRPPLESRPMIEKAIAAVDALGTRVGDLGRLHFAHIEARYLERWNEAQQRLAQPAKDPWDNVLRATLLARIHAARSEWAHVARICKEARTATVAMPGQGGNLGQYLVAYVDYLDGIAHYGAVTTYNDPGYLADAFSRMVACLGATASVCDPSDPLIEAGVHWLYWIGDLANRMNVPDAKAIRTGITAYLGAQGLGQRISEQQRRETPPLVWYDAGRLLALSGAP